MNGSAIPDPEPKPRFEPGPLYCVVEYYYKNATTYERGKREGRYILATSLTESGARTQFNELRENYRGSKRWREGPNWFSYRCMSISEIRLEQL